MKKIGKFVRWLGYVCLGVGKRLLSLAERLEKSGVGLPVARGTLMVTAYRAGGGQKLHLAHLEDKGSSYWGLDMRRTLCGLARVNVKGVSTRISLEDLRLCAICRRCWQRQLALRE